MGGLPFAFALTLLTAPPVETVAPLCAPHVQLAQPEQCPALGPGLYAAQYAGARLPEPLPELITERLPVPAKVIDFTYARVTTPDAPLFATPEEAAAGSAAKTTGKGFVFVSLVNQTQQGDQVLYQIRGGEYIRAGDVTVVEPTRFQGIKLSERPAYPLGWVVANVRPSPAPGAAAPKGTRSLRRGLVVQIFGEVQVGRWKWYLVGAGQWVEQRVLSVISFNPPPEGVTGKWVQVDLYEQTLVAYEDATPVYATLVSSGLDKWATQPGLFQIYARLLTDRMSGAYAPDKSDYYYLEAVPWVMYFDGDRALHGEYWHDRLGFKRSHGCVNLSPLDSQWLFNWSEKGTHVWVYDPSGQTKAEGVAEGP